ncbi:WXG100 family type VII secretion target [Rhizohabitans arisaemae]|uniref:WXG100 family type VII secretion target n=1 Tax=Rhizohabitans arisaemae TaxID=2720610 RepID=UPI0024B23983|nr:WXG100 family type VII secretion target [Rhizohabitans arisaemae]
MADGFVGGDLAEMQNMSAQFKQQADQIRQVMAALDREAAKIGVAWKGDRANRFRDSWQNYRTAFQRMSEEIDEAARFVSASRGDIDASTR